MRLISGMHRSGTSLVARLFFEAGADMGDPGTFYPADRWNREGYYEQTDIHDINMPLVNGRLWKLAYLFLPSEQTICRRGRDLGGQIQSTAAKYREKVVKENRFCLTLPAWLEQGADVEKILLVFREPAAVARSVRRRNKTTFRRALSLWEEHNRRLVRTAENHEIPLQVVRYELLLDAERQTLEAGAALEYFDVDVSRPFLEALMAEVVNLDMNHHGRRNPDADYPRSVRELRESLLERHARQSPTNDGVALSEEV